MPPVKKVRDARKILKYLKNSGKHSNNLNIRKILKKEKKKEEQPRLEAVVLRQEDFDFLFIFGQAVAHELVFVVCKGFKSSF